MSAKKTEDQLMKSISTMAHTFIAPSAGLDDAGKSLVLKELKRFTSALVDLNPPENLPLEYLDELVNSLVLKYLLISFNQQAKAGQEESVAIEKEFVNSIKSNSQLQFILEQWIAYYDKPKRIFQAVENSVEIALVKRLLSQALDKA